MKQRMILPVLAVLSLGLLAAGCGSDDESSSSTAAQAPQSTQAAAAGKDVVALAQGNPDLSTLVKAVTAADLVETLQKPGPYTVFAPTNEAFAALGEEKLTELLKPENKDELTKILTYHVVPSAALSSDLSNGQMLKTVEGQDAAVTIDGDTVKVGDATVTAADVEASNGVVHVIDQVLVPPAA